MTQTESRPDLDRGRPVDTGTERTVRVATGIDIAYETFGDPTDPPVLLVMGLGTQMIAWPDEFCQGIADCGHYVIRFDNRDTGQSTHLRHLRAPSAVTVTLRARRPPYKIGDLARDTVGLMDALGLESVHLVGISMGGFIAQTVAIYNEPRIRSLTLIMTSTGSRFVGIAKPQLVLHMLRKRSVSSREEAIESAVDTFKVLGSPGYDFDDARIRDVAARSWDRGHDPGGYLRQLAAVVGQPDRTKKLRRLRIPSLVIHGYADPLVTVSGGKALAKAIPGARFLGFKGMGHDMPRELWPRFADEICTLAAEADGRNSAA